MGKPRQSLLQQMFSNERFQIIYGLALIIFIPTAIVVATVLTISRYSETIDVTLQRQALILGRVFGTSVWQEGQDAAALQARIAAVGSSNPDILDVTVLTPTEEGFTITASLHSETVGATVSAPYYSLAWQQAEGEGLATDFLATPANGAILPTLAATRGRYWLVSLPLFSDANNDGRRERVALLSLQMSSDVVDRQADASWKSAMLGLIFVVLLTVLFLGAATRLWSYATLYRKIKEVDQMKDEFISIASHELRTPITAIRGYVSMAQDGDFGPLPERLQEGLARVRSSTERLGELVEDLLNVSRIEQRRLEVHLQPIDLAAVVLTVTEELQPMAKQKKLTLHFDASGSSPRVQADPDRLKQVLINVIGNAIKYTPKGSVEVSMGVKAGAGGWVRVKDTGLGISAEDQQRLFSKFYRVSSDQTRAIPGTGLGLWITKQLVELMKGKIMLESIEGTGTQVTVTLPLAKPAVEKKDDN
ncbi:MAG: HAMP domain-containing sensor histidine kinase [Patescibacteria group bacterium]|nr:HAMP domain-containing sensor histidine kinase [Patescibacteria group bacterium]